MTGPSSRISVIGSLILNATSYFPPKRSVTYALMESSVSAVWTSGSITNAVFVPSPMLYSFSSPASKETNTFATPVLTQSSAPFPVL